MKRLAFIVLSLFFEFLVVNLLSKDAVILERHMKYVVLDWSAQQATVIQEGTMTAPVFRRFFLDGYVLAGERFRAPKDAVLTGILLASDGNSVISVPIFKWTIANGDFIFMCQATNEGQPPAISLRAGSRDEMLNQIKKALSGSGATGNQP